jgi:hypothetical protein
MRWAELEQAEPRLVTVMRRRLIEPGVLLLVTLRRDGTPRLSPVEPFVLDGDLWLSMLWQSRKAADVQRDPRVLLHSIITSRDGEEGEIKLRGTAHGVGDEAVQARYAQAVQAALGWSPQVGRFHLFRIEIDDVTALRYDERTGDQFVSRWPAGEEFVRRGTSATSVGAAQPRHDLLGSTQQVAR